MRGGASDEDSRQGSFSENIRSARLELSPFAGLESYCGGNLPWMSEASRLRASAPRHVCCLCVFALARFALSPCPPRRSQRRTSTGHAHAAALPWPTQAVDTTATERKQAAEDARAKEKGEEPKQARGADRHQPATSFGPPFSGALGGV